MFIPLLKQRIGDGRLTELQIKGKAGEDEALSYLVRQGLTLIERNFRCRGGEIDLIMQDGGEVVFVEVRKRSSRRYGGAAASVTAAKQSRLIVAAHMFLQRYRKPAACRFDIVAIDQNAISWLKDAFES
jgi:putative endonuclease